MEQKSQFEHQLDPELLEEIEEWEQQEHTGPEEYYFSNPRSLFQARTVAAQPSQTQFLV